MTIMQTMQEWEDEFIDVVQRIRCRDLPQHRVADPFYTELCEEIDVA